MKTCRRKIFRGGDPRLWRQHPLFVSGFRHRETRQGWYLWVKDAEQLPLFAQHLSLVRPALVSQISVMLAVVPEQHTSGDDFTQFCGAGSVLSSSAVRHLARSHRCGP
jgi:thioesterase domain-containing protein